MPKGEFFTDEATPNVLLTPGNFSVGGGFQTGKPKYYAGPLPNTYVLKEGEVVVSMTDLSKGSDTLGYAAKVPITPGVTYWHNQRIGLLQAMDEQRACKDWLHYLMRTREYRAWVVGSASGTTVKHTSPSRIESFSFPLPPITEQRAMAEILGVLDERIDNLRQTSATLEAIAQALFKSWFVDFDAVRAKSEGREPKGMDAATAALFPSGFEDSELGPIPQGWSISRFDHEFDFTMGQSPPGSTYNKGRIGAPFFQGCTDFGEVFPSERVYCSQPTRFTRAGDVLMSVRAPVGALNIASVDCSIGRGLCAIRHKSRSTGLTHQFVSACMARIERAAGEGALFNSLSKQQLASLPVLVANTDVTEAVASLLDALTERRIEATLQTAQLGELRDTLLPRLISGKLRTGHESVTSAEG